MNQGGAHRWYLEEITHQDHSHAAKGQLVVKPLAQLRINLCENAGIGQGNFVDDDQLRAFQFSSGSGQRLGGAARLTFILHGNCEGRVDGSASWQIL